MRKIQVRRRATPPPFMASSRTQPLFRRSEEPDLSEVEGISRATASAQGSDSGRAQGEAASEVVPNEPNREKSEIITFDSMSRYDLEPCHP